MTKTTFRGQIVGIRRLNNSRNGNPRYKLRIYKFDETRDFTTVTDAGFAYAIYDGMLNKYAQFVINGRNQITDMSVEQ